MRRNKVSGNHFHRRYQTAPWDTFAATRPSSQITLGKLVIISSLGLRHQAIDIYIVCLLIGLREEKFASDFHETS